MNVSRLNLVSPSSGVASLRPRLGGELPWFTIVLSLIAGLLWMRLEIGILLPSYVQEEEFIIVLELIKEENFIQLCEHTCIVRAVFMSLSFLMVRWWVFVCGKMYSIGHSWCLDPTTFLCFLRVSWKRISLYWYCCCIVLDGSIN